MSQLPACPHETQVSAPDNVIPAQDIRGAADPTVDIGEQTRLRARRRERLMSIGSPIALLLAWEAAAQFGLIDVRFFPAPSSIIAVLVRMLGSGELIEH